ncbi:CoA transferase [Rhizobium sp. CRIBSB]|nr:CoA transferase [Rhizobium sp. CRIBSB]
MTSKALEGVRILDMSRILAAPLASQLLADLGADVIKVERPEKGDESREYGPPFLTGRDGEATTDAAFFLSCNRNKRSVTVDIATAKGQEILRRLVMESDVLIENFKTGSLARYGLDYASLRALNPRLVYCSITGFGQTGPMAKKPGYDGVFQAIGGMMSVSGLPDHAPGGGPMKVGISMVDILTSLYASSAILAALHHRDASGGEGQHIDLSLLDCGVASLSHFAMNYLVSGQIPERRGNGGYGGVPSQTFRCADRDIFLTAGNDSQFKRLCIALDSADLAADPRFNSTAGRITNRDALLKLLDSIFLERTAAEWLDRLDLAEVPSGPVNDIAGALSNPQIVHREMVREIEHPSAGLLKILSNPIRLSATPIETYVAPPTIGQHTDEILHDIGFSEPEIAAMRQSRIV